MIGSSKIVEPLQQPTHVNLGQVGNSFVGSKQEESIASNASKSANMEDDKKVH